MSPPREATFRAAVDAPGVFHEALIRFRHVFKIYRVADTGVVALGGVDFDIAEGEFLAVVGPSGSGKSTILNMIGGLDRATAGTVEVEGRDLGRLEEDALTEYRRDRVGFVWQGTARNLVPYLNVLENVRLPSTASGVRVPAARRSPRELLEVVGLADRAKHRPGQLSGGEQQRVAVAVALSNVPRILLADEPTAELDSESAALVLDAFHGVNQEFGVTIVMVTHDLLAAERAGRQLRLRDGQLLVQGRPMEPLGMDGKARLPDEAVDALAGTDLEVEVRDGEVRIRRRGEGGLVVE
ncbi:MAG: ABC transporter ATP-binding protein [Actinobacteria bacterium]|nr:ABC transporter ATP-binding protein [Actinomycetota bacterium]